jgi:hypothetical protein
VNLRRAVRNDDETILRPTVSRRNCRHTLAQSQETNPIEVNERSDYFIFMMIHGKQYCQN